MARLAGLGVGERLERLQIAVLNPSPTCKRDRCRCLHGDRVDNLWGDPPGPLRRTVECRPRQDAPRDPGASVDHMTGQAAGASTLSPAMSMGPR